VWSRRRPGFVRSWAAAAGGAALVLGPAAVWLLSLPGFVDDVFRSQIDRPGLPLETRWYFIRQDVLRDPLIPLALIAAGWMLARAPDPRLRTLALVTLGTTVALTFGFQTFFGYYLVLALPWMAVVLAVSAFPCLRRIAVRRARVLLVSATLVLAGALPALYAEIYYRTADDHVSSPAGVVSRLTGGSGYVYSMYPSFALWSGRDLYPWYYSADSLVARFTGRIGDQDFVRVFTGCQALVLWAGELEDYPRARVYVEQHFRVAYQDQYYTLWLRADR